ncbi:uncharacterized protein LOC113763764 [Coffea eugenioides]|uniref:uncharacterized protein LOC113763764 n=1 Tax=Coffea eugenioides TaxID=49369 RepID=UPI000F606356|nr:uncharacterized protein LOC113762362 isoform X1 [Coffea eugenioides]XP_027161580.1 uncharacterized protein LOC113762362 isoform X1 [Coffea eugenioides]XP_027163483.1 uncharacterized protein LOC113763764 [Coffea eugenioides]
MIQNDLVHGWGLDFALRRCVEPAHEKIDVVDSQWIVHQVIPSLGSQGQSENGKAPWQGVRERCRSEWVQFQDRLANADKKYIEQFGRTRYLNNRKFCILLSFLAFGSDWKRNIETLEKNSVTSLRTLINLGSEVYMQADVMLN